MNNETQEAELTLDQMRDDLRQRIDSFLGNFTNNGYINIKTGQDLTIGAAQLGWFFRINKEPWRNSEELDLDELLLVVNALPEFVSQIKAVKNQYADAINLLDKISALV